jgi:hypothetical protein
MLKGCWRRGSREAARQRKGLGLWWAVKLVGRSSTASQLTAASTVPRASPSNRASFHIDSYRTGPSERQRAMVTTSAGQRAVQKRNVPSSDHPSRCTSLGTRHRKGLLSESSCWGTSSHSPCDRSLGKRPFMADHAQNDMARQEKEERGGCPKRLCLPVPPSRLPLRGKRSEQHGFKLYRLDI